MIRTQQLLFGAVPAILIALAGALFVASPTQAFGQEQETPEATEQNMMAMRKNMMAMREKMMAEMKAADSRLQQLLDQMNAATGDAKVDAVAALVTELTAQHRAAQQRMGQMMMPRMMEMMGMMQGMMGGRGAGATRAP